MQITGDTQMSILFFIINNYGCQYKYLFKYSKHILLLNLQMILAFFSSLNSTRLQYPI